MCWTSNWDTPKRRGSNQNRKGDRREGKTKRPYRLCSRPRETILLLSFVNKLKPNLFTTKNKTQSFLKAGGLVLVSSIMQFSRWRNLFLLKSSLVPAFLPAKQTATVATTHAVSFHSTRFTCEKWKSKWNFVSLFRFPWFISFFYTLNSMGEFGGRVRILF